MLASGGNDNILQIWDQRILDKPMIQFREHLAAVRAISWSPTQDKTLITGGGTADRSIKFWNLDYPESLKSILTTSQVKQSFIINLLGLFNYLGSR